jgi:hypothetical protein
MRRLLFMLVSVTLLTMLAGCQGIFHAHGVCDCEDDEYCSSRSPWVHGAHMVPAIPLTTTLPAEAVPAPAPMPAKLPDVKKKDLE